eukprot:scaffold4014_cov154-Ochromonas_danica.AAC.1
MTELEREGRESTDRSRKIYVCFTGFEEGRLQPSGQPSTQPSSGQPSGQPSSVPSGQPSDLLLAISIEMEMSPHFVWFLDKHIIKEGLQPVADPNRISLSGSDQEFIPEKISNSLFWGKDIYHSGWGREEDSSI